MLHTTCYMLHATCYMQHATCDITTCYMLHYIWYILQATNYILYATSFMLYATYYKQQFYIMLHAISYMLHAPWWRNKHSFCSGSCDEIHATSNLSNKTSLKHSWNTFKLFFKFYWNTLKLFGASSKRLWNCLQTPFYHPLNFLRWNPLKLPVNTLKTSLKHPLNFLEPPLKLSVSTPKT